MLSLGTILPDRPCCVFYATRHQAYWGLIHNMVFLLVLSFDLISHTHMKNLLYIVPRYLSFQKFIICRSHMLIKFSKRKFFPWNVKNDDRSGMNKQNTHTINTQRNITLERVGYYENLKQSLYFTSLSFFMGKIFFFRIKEGQLWHG